MRTWFGIPLIGVVALSLASVALAQRPPAIQGFNGTTVTPETAKDEKKAEDKAGVAIKNAVTREDKGPLSDLIPGTTVVIRHGTDVTEGIVSTVQRAENQITVRYANKKTEKLVLTDKESKDVRSVEYSDETSHKVTRYFKLKS